MWKKEIVFLIICWAMFIRFASFSETLIGDENYCHNVFKTDESVRQVWKWTKYCDVSCFPGDYLIMYPLRKVDDIFTLRFPRMVFCLVGFIFLYLVCGRYFKTTVGYVVTFLIACLNINLIAYSFQLRPYSILPVLSIISLYCAHRVTEKPSTLAKVLISTFYILIAFYHPYSILIASLPLLFVCLAKRCLIPPKWLIMALLTAFIVWCYYTYGSRVIWSQDINYDTFEYIPSLITHPKIFFQFLYANIVGNKLLIPFTIGFLSLFSKGRSNQWGFLLTLVMLPIMALFVGSLLNQYWFLQRQFVWVIPYFAILTGWLWDTWARKIRRLRCTN